MEAATDDGSGSGSSVGCDWSRLPEDMLVNVLGAMHVADAVRSGAVCTSWHAAYTAFRRHRVPSPRQPPCLLYASDFVDPGDAALHCPASGSTLRIPFPRAPLARRPLLGSGRGWLVTADEASDLHLLNPVTRAQVALPPITALYHVKSFTDELGDPVYNEHGDPMYKVYENLLNDQCKIDLEPTILDAPDAYCMYYRVVLSASPSAGRACIVLLLHMPHGEISFARLGDERWTVVKRSDDTGLPWRFFYTDAMYNDVDGLFYLLRHDGTMISLELNGPSPVARQILSSAPKPVSSTKYLVQTPSGDILQVWRVGDYDDLPPGYEDEKEFNTTDLQLYKVDLDHGKVEMIKSLPDYVLFLGYNGSMCLPVKDFPGLKSNCAYITADFEEYVDVSKSNRREIGIWSMKEKSMSSLVDVSQFTCPWLNWPSPIWIKPSFL
ncbi:uncharacterized protein LOC133887097 [Phragmites australis]|uniref:uncharacterized protein LOC133887097 n=1 Tax=Phragmites australis TaxID=29695 RepID=UPI002D786197|nr:uncharacterized protein LOC133887097 [Phragmites australis]